MFVRSQTLKGKITHWALMADSELLIAGERKEPSQGISNKPAGLWLDWNDGWKEWCESESFHDGLKNYECLDAEVKPFLKVWLIDSRADFFNLWRRFYREEILNAYDALKKLRKINEGLRVRRSQEAESFARGILTLHFFDFWKWLKDKCGIEAVALTGKGQAETRFGTWLYGWDCSSIVVFDPKNVRLKKQGGIRNEMQRLWGKVKNKLPIWKA